MSDLQRHQVRQRKIIAEVVRFEGCTTPHLHKHCCPEISFNTANKVINALVQTGHLCKYTLDETTNRRFFCPGPRTNVQLGRTKNPKPLGPEQLERALATAAYCRLPGIMRPRLTLEELRTRYPDVDVSIFAQNAFYDDVAADGKTRLAAIHVHFSLSPSQRVAQCEKHVERLSRVPELRKLLDNDGFLLAIVTDRDKPNHIEQLCRLLEDTPAHWQYSVKFRIGIIAPFVRGATAP